MCIYVYLGSISAAMKLYLRYCVIYALLCLFIQVSPLDDGKKLHTRSDAGSAGSKTSDTQPEGYKHHKNTLENNKGQIGAKGPVLSTQLPLSPITNPSAESNCTNSTDIECEQGIKPSLSDIISSMVSENKGMLTRTLYVLIGVTFIVVVYYVMRAVR